MGNFVSLLRWPNHQFKSNKNMCDRAWTGLSPLMVSFVLRIWGIYHNIFAMKRKKSFLIYISQICFIVTHVKTCSFDFKKEMVVWHNYND